MDLISLVLLLLVFALVGFIVWLIVKFIPMPEPFQKVIIVACVVLLVLYLLGIVAGHAPVLSLHR